MERALCIQYYQRRYVLCVWVDACGVCVCVCVCACVCVCVCVCVCMCVGLGSGTETTYSYKTKSEHKLLVFYIRTNSACLKSGLTQLHLCSHCSQ